MAAEVRTARISGVWLPGLSAPAGRKCGKIYQVKDLCPGMGVYAIHRQCQLLPALLSGIVSKFAQTAGIIRPMLTNLDPCLKIDAGIQKLLH